MVVILIYTIICCNRSITTNSKLIKYRTMFFNSYSFVLFFLSLLVGVLLIQWSPGVQEHKKLRWRNIILLVSSYYFYAFLRWEYLLLLLLTTLINYYCGQKLGKLTEKKEKKKYVFLAVFVSIGILAYFKYANFFIDSVVSALSLLGIAPQLSLAKIALPIGISFFTFQALSYTLDVYNGKMQARKSFVDVALYVSFFPTILSGPIERGRNLIPQIEEYTPLRLSECIEGGKQFLWGLFKKIVIADRLAAYINIVYGGSPEDFSSMTLLMAAVLYSFQIYTDFSGYSDMAIGIGRVLGFRLMTNFKFPYFATSIKEFWKRWHISLTSWFTEYVYIPMGGNRVSEVRWLINISAVFLLSGLWHGANWTFILWGALHTVYYLVEHYYRKWKPVFLLMEKPWLRRLSNLVSVVLVFVLVTIAWVFFRVEDFSKACAIVSRFTDLSGGLYWGMSAFTTMLALFLLFLFFCMEWLLYRQIKLPWVLNAMAYAVVLAMTVLFSVTSGGFVYFQF